MDPDAALARLRLLAEEPATEENFEEFRTTFQGLDDWLSRNGFMPRAWWQKEEHETRPVPEWAAEIENAVVTPAGWAGPAERLHYDVRRCSQCNDLEAVVVEYGMCASCLHDARRSGWEPGGEMVHSSGGDPHPRHPDCEADGCYEGGGEVSC